MEITRHTRIEDLPQMLSVEEMCSFLGIGRSLGYEMVRRDEVPSIRLGRLLRIPRTALVQMNAPEAKR